MKYSKLPLLLFLFIQSVVISAQNLLPFAYHREVCIMPAVVKESSGLAIIAPNLMWTHGDSGNENKLFLIDSTRQLIRTLTIVNAINNDWEDLAIDANGDLWINDAGNNGNARQNLAIIKVKNPSLHDSIEVHGEFINFTFEDQTEFPPPNSRRNFDIEGIIKYKDSIIMFTKNRSNPQTGITKMYKLPATPGSYIAELIDSIYLGATNQLARVTAADYDSVSGKLALLTPAQLVIFENFTGSNFFGGDVTYYKFKYPTNQVEAIGFIDTNRLYMTDEVPGGWYEVILSFEEDNSASIKPVETLFKHHFDNDSKSLIIFNEKQVNYTLKIFNNFGQEVYSNSGNQKQDIFSLNKLSNGIFYVTLFQTDGDIVSIKLRINT